MKREKNLRLENFGVRGRYWTIDISTATKVSEIPSFYPSIKLFFHVLDAIRSFARWILQPFATSTLVVNVIGVRGEVDQKFELLVADGHDAKDIQVVSISSTLFWLLSFWKSPSSFLISICICRWVFYQLFKVIFIHLVNNSAKVNTHIIIKNVACSNKGDVWLLTIGSSILALVHSNTLKSKLTDVFNTHIKNQGQVVARKVMTLFYLIGVLLSFFFINYM
jgi:hypothetical protein